MQASCGAGAHRGTSWENRLGRDTGGSCVGMRRLQVSPLGRGGRQPGLRSATRDSACWCFAERRARVSGREPVAARGPRLPQEASPSPLHLAPGPRCLQHCSLLNSTSRKVHTGDAGLPAPSCLSLQGKGGRRPGRAGAGAGACCSLVQQGHAVLACALTDLCLSSPDVIPCTKVLSRELHNWLTASLGRICCSCGKV